jgi:hypothetical protein
MVEERLRTRPGIPCVHIHSPPLLIHTHARGPVRTQPRHPTLQDRLSAVPTFPPCPPTHHAAARLRTPCSPQTIPLSRPSASSVWSPLHAARTPAAGLPLRHFWSFPSLMRRPRRLPPLPPTVPFRCVSGARGASTGRPAPASLAHHRRHRLRLARLGSRRAGRRNRGPTLLILIGFPGFGTAKVKTLVPGRCCLARIVRSLASCDFQMLLLRCATLLAASLSLAPYTYT